MLSDILLTCYSRIVRDFGFRVVVSSFSSSPSSSTTSSSTTSDWSRRDNRSSESIADRDLNHPHSHPSDGQNTTGVSSTTGKTRPLHTPLLHKIRTFSTMASKPALVPEGILLGIGNPLLDMTIQGNQTLLDRYDLKSNNAVLATPQQRPIFHEIVEKFSPQYIAGGATQNSIRVAQWLLQTPNATTFFGGVGNDKFKDILEQKAQEVGVNVRYQVYDEHVTGTCAAIIVGEDRSLLTELGAAERFCLSNLRKPDNWELVEKADFYYLGGFLLSVSPDSILEVAKHASAENKTVVSNLHATFLCKYFADTELDLMKHIDFLFGNEDEAAEFAKCAGFDSTDPKEIASKISQLPKANVSRQRVVVVTRGKKSTFLAADGEVREIPVTPVDPAEIKDTNGCGDAFVGGFLSQLVLGKSLSDCVRCGTYAANTVIRRFGCTYPDHPDFS